MKLREDWRNAARFISIRAAAGQTAFLIAWSQLPADLKGYLPGWLMPGIAMTFLGVGVFGIMVRQAPPAEKQKEVPDVPDPLQ
jgi:hypothetical protein